MLWVDHSTRLHPNLPLTRGGLLLDPRFHGDDGGTIHFACLSVGKATAGLCRCAHAGVADSDSWHY